MKVQDLLLQVQNSHGKPPVQTGKEQFRRYAEWSALYIAVSNPSSGANTRHRGALENCRPAGASRSRIRMPSIYAIETAEQRCFGKLQEGVKTARRTRVRPTSKARGVIAIP